MHSARSLKIKGKNLPIVRTRVSPLEVILLKVNVTYFENGGPAHTDETLRLAAERAKALGIKHVVIPTTSGATAAKALDVIKGAQLIVVTHMAGFVKPGEHELLPEHRKKLQKAGVAIHTASHALSGVERGIRQAFGMVGFGILLASALRMFGQGTKVAVEITLMAADAGLIPATQSIVALGGTGSGVDTALVIKPAHTNNVLDLRIEEVICKPR
jgi:hypothetical protein